MKTLRVDQLNPGRRTKTRELPTRFKAAETEAEIDRGAETEEVKFAQGSLATSCNKRRSREECEQ